jgi:class 3 adenylate cyclase/tetratricopeptide (TPR) repeat protein
MKPGLGSRNNATMGACTQCGAALPAGARFCPACAAPVPLEAPSAERKLATVLFADLVGSTELAGAEDPERTRAMLERFYEGMASEVEQAGGTVEKFAGDAVMAAFGVPTAYEDHAERALHAALAMQRKLKDMFGDRLDLRIGVNTGDVVVGPPHEGGSFVSGDAVNVGARLEQAADQGEILVGERTARAARGAFEFGDPTTVEAKGKPGGIVCRRLIRALSLMRPRGVGGLRRAFVGREDEFEQLQQLYGRVAAERRPRLVTILGEAGVGKTRLMRELWEWLGAQSPEPLRRTGRCLSYGQGITYWPLGEILKEHAGILDSDPAEVVADRLGRRRFLGMTLGLPVAEDVHPLVARERLHDSWVEFLDELVAERPTVVLIEDLHWAEGDLFDLLETVIAHVQGPLLLLATARPEVVDVRPGWGSGPESSSLRLEALPPTSTGRLLDELLGVELSPGVREVVVERAEGNPFFLEELIAMLVDTRVLESRQGGWSLIELPPEFEVPDSVQAVLAARIDLLPPGEKAALQAASVIGRVFWTGPVYELVEGASPDFGLLEERDFVRRRSGSSLAGEREYVVKHALTREVAYASLPKETRARHHAAFASWLERRGEGRDEQAPLLAHHYAEAVRPEDLDLAWTGREEEAEELRGKALVWSRRAAELAIGRYEIEEGITLLQRAVDLEPDRSERAKLWEEIAHASALTFDGEAFREAMENAIALAGPSAERYSELALQTARRSGMWKRAPDRDIADAWFDQALALARKGTRAYAESLAAVALWRRDEAAATELYGLAVRAGDTDLRSTALAARVDIAWTAGEAEQACRWAQERLELVPGLSDPDDAHFALMNGALIYLAMGRLPEARQTSRRLEEMVAGLTPHHRLHGLATTLDIEAFLGRWQAVRDLTPSVEQAVEHNRTTPCPAHTRTLIYCAVAHSHAEGNGEPRRLEAEADVHRLEGFGAYVQPAEIRLALIRKDAEELRRLVGVPPSVKPTVPDGVPAYLDALVALGERERIEAEAPQWAESRTSAAPFALRALGWARGSQALIEQAAARFEELGHEGRADETRKGTR